jgi:hypothetical protein
MVIPAAPSISGTACVPSAPFVIAPWRNMVIALARPADKTALVFAPICLPPRVCQGRTTKWYVQRRNDWQIS